MTYLGFGDALVKVGFGLAAATVLLAVLGIATKDRRFVDASRHAMLACGLMGAGAAACLVAGFFRGAYDVGYIFGYSERKLSAAKKFAGLWAGLDGSILFWAAILSVVGSCLAWGFRKKDLDPARRRLEPFVYAVFACVEVFFFGVIACQQNPFDPMKPDALASLTRSGLATGGMPQDGAGLNPLLDTYWMMIHPPSVYLGFILYTVPFAYGAAALLAGEFSPAWIKATRGWTMVAWLFNTNGVILGGLWAYEVLGWGGYWAWDPVENASFLPWLAGTAFLHSVMVQERRGMLRAWNALLVCVTFIFSIFGTYLTRSGIVSSVHAFGENSALSVWFLTFLFLLLGFTVFMLFFRMPHLRSERSIDSLFCREAVFVLNNFVLLSIAAAITILVLWPKISYEFTKQSVTVGVPVYNRVCTPLFIALFALTAIGPALGWVKTSTQHFVRNLVVPVVPAALLAVVTQWIAWDVVRGGDQGDLFAWADHLYPTFVMLFLCWLIVLSLGLEVARTAWRAGSSSGRGFLGALARMLTMQNRRYGGYLVHVGLAMLGVAVTISSMYRVQGEVKLSKGERVPITANGRFQMELRGVTVRPAQAGQAYDSARTQVAIYKDGTEIASLEPEARYWPMTPYRPDEPRETTEVDIARLFGQDVYVHFDRQPMDGRPLPPAAWWDAQKYVFTVYRNPFMWLLWSGWITMILGGAYAALPLGGRKVGLAG